MSGPPPLRVVVCGTNFGRFYIQAVLDHPGYVLAGILSRGSAASRDHARRLGVPHHTDVGELPDDVDVACVVVGSSIQGGEGTALAKALIGRGVHVLQEHPVHLGELTECLKLARAHRVQYRLNTHYPHVGPVRAFIEAARRLAVRREPLFVDAATPIHLMYPMVDILGRALGSLRPWRFAAPAPVPGELGAQPFRVLQGLLGGVPLTLRVHHQMDPADRDNHALHWHRLSVGTEGGVLTLADTHGPLLWSPRLHVGRDSGHRFVLDGPGTGDLGLATVTVAGGAGTFREVFTELWPQAIGLALDGMRDAVAEGGDALRAAQYDLAVCRIWSDLAARLGPPEIVRPSAPRPLAAVEVFPGLPAPGEVRAPAPSPRHQAADAAPHVPPAEAPYVPSAEFFDLVATEHTATGSAAAIAGALAGVDLSHGPVVDIGAGTGLVTEAVARARPDAEILACEPAVGMRAVLTSRVFSDPYLRPRVTITADAAPELELPDRVSAVLLCGVLGHLDAGRRERLWERLLPRLAPGGVVIVELMGLETPLVLPEARMATARAGRHRYEWWFSGAPGDDPGEMRLRTTWRVYREDEDAPLREVRDSYRWIPFGLRQVAEESGLHPRALPTRPGAPPLAMLTRRPPC
ncbi:methyltransferase domain-containing protein [Sphaerisporangium album]|uniref:Methyltransferase domain-containing protein n=1 Tax=Sphaerisporangium album TaxID=509200 RepID=A0A367FFV4_9ACTN|nr:Gfo/Idh/MocA family oxidoreductase [Sphaerisporangium album]RCG28577.1 methyltransferase domain-containing protein [Sphaerisporangium album]